MPLVLFFLKAYISAKVQLFKILKANMVKNPRRVVTLYIFLDILGVSGPNHDKMTCEIVAQ